MVAMSRRKTPRRGWSSRFGNVMLQQKNFPMVFLCLLLIVIVVQAWRLLWRVSSSSSNSNSNSNSLLVPPPPHPAAAAVSAVRKPPFQQKLLQKQPVLRVQQQQQQQQQKQQPPPPPPPPPKQDVAKAADDDVHNNNKEENINQHAEEEIEKEDDEEENGKQEEQKQKQHDNEDKTEPDNNNNNNNNKINNNKKDDAAVVFEKHGSGPTVLGYVADYAYERRYPPFRQNAAAAESQTINNETYWNELALTVARQVQVTAVQACPSTTTAISSSTTTTTKKKKKKCDMDDDDTRWIVYNGASFHRFICGMVVKPRQSLLVPDDCPIASSLLLSSTTTTLQPPSSHSAHDHDNEAPPLQILSSGGQAMPPIVVLPSTTTTTTTQEDTTASSSTSTSTSTIKEISCDIPCHWHTDAWTQTTATLATTMTTTAKNNIHDDHKNNNNKNNKRPAPPAHVRIQGTPWHITWTGDADPAVTPLAAMEPTAFQRNQYYATASWKSDIPIQSYFDFDTFESYFSSPQKAPAVDFDEVQPAVASVLNHDCTYMANSAIGRSKWMGSLRTILSKEQVKFYGACQHTSELPHDIPSLDTLEHRIALLKRHRMVIAYETSTEKYRVTDIVWEALLSGAVPVILGASNIEPDILPPHSALLASNYQSWDDFSQFVLSVLHNKTAWQSYQTWRTNDTLVHQFLHERMNFTRTSPHCRTCRWAYAKQYGWGWNTKQQTVVQPFIPRDRLCVSSSASDGGDSSSSNDHHHHHNNNKWVTRPFRESWYDGSHYDDNMKHDKDVLRDADDETLSSSSCGENLVTSYMENLGLERTVWHHDGFTDLRLRWTNHSSSDNASKNEHDEAAAAAADRKTRRKITTTTMPKFLVLRVQVPIRNLKEGAMFRHVHTLLKPPALRTSTASSAAIQDERAKVTIVANFVVHDITSPDEGILEIVIPTNALLLPTTTTGNAIAAPHPGIRIITEDVNPIHDKLTEYYPSSFAQMAMQDFIDPLELFYVVA